MNRIIKFRAWDKKTDAFIYFDLNKIQSTDLNEITEIWSQELEWQQFTGLTDKNGKEIYEGDVVAFEDSDGGYEYPDVVVNTGIVEYGELRFYFTNRVAAEMDDFYIKDGRCDDVEVIGNIHENPELLGVE